MQSKKWSCSVKEILTPKCTLLCAAGWAGSQTETPGPRPSSCWRMLGQGLPFSVTGYKNLSFTQDLEVTRYFHTISLNPEDSFPKRVAQGLSPLTVLMTAVGCWDAKDLAEVENSVLSGNTSTGIQIRDDRQINGSLDWQVLKKNKRNKKSLPSHSLQS